MNDDQMLAAMEISAHELRDLLHKTNHFFNSLTHDERRRFNRSQQTTEQSADSLGVGVTGEQLEDFLRRYGKEPSIRGFWCRHHHEDDPPSPAK